MAVMEIQMEGVVLMPPVPARACGVVFAGPLAAGKDTVAPALFEFLGHHAQHVSLGAGLKRELDDVLAVMRTTTPARWVGEVAGFLCCTSQQASFLVGLLKDCDLDLVSAWERSDHVRAALQFLGTDVRRSQDPDYWVRQAVASAREALSCGQWVFVTDCRFPNDVEGFVELGFLSVRLQVSEATQAQRLWLRDGLVLRPEVTSHSSETALDVFPFDVVLDNDGSLSDAVECLASLPFFVSLRP